MPAEQPTILATSGGLKPGARSRLEFGLLLHHAVEPSIANVLEERLEPRYLG